MFSSRLAQTYLWVLHHILCRVLPQDCYTVCVGQHLLPVPREHIKRSWARGGSKLCRHHPSSFILHRSPNVAMLYPHSDRSLLEICSFVILLLTQLRSPPLGQPWPPRDAHGPAGMPYLQASRLGGLPVGMRGVPALPPLAPSVWISQDTI